ncbi:Relaxase/mobilization nuclease family protein (modular protein) [Hyphomicrobium sp. GJ21]|uniref:relaxase/mobilization nuclease domain-containing protein n=1 Tax=Hyphomicrobium sp. GJ21 TaxID=113574 RepID=UPI000622BA23|nr:relaxase/mobilization nuclease domain-containing protein [Hyphomicrobium sp. GJ21]CEJ88131.1 Relaxase/mobilization nuclease family protein (modular protein) [Hyphomicrobium sp. GJ21]
MIGKVAAKGGRGFRGAINYLLRGRKGDEDPERVAWSDTRNLLTADPDLAPMQMRALAAMARKSRKPLYHVVLSWHRDEAPTDDLMRLVADTTLADLGLSDHQAALVAHKNTNHRHLHIIVNKVHPETLKSWSTSNDYKRIELSIARQALEHGMTMVPGRFNSPEQIAKTSRRVKDGEFQRDYRHGRPDPLPHYSISQIHALRELLSSAFVEATDWDHLANMLASEAVTLQRKGQGLILAGADGFMKLSDLGKQVRLRGLEDRFGETFANYDKRRDPVALVLEPEEVKGRHTPSHRAERLRPENFNKDDRKDKDAKGPTTSDDEDSATTADADLAEVERLRALERLKRIARAEAAREARRAAETTDDTAARRKSGAENANSTSSGGSAGTSPRRAAFEDLAGSRAGHDIAKKMHAAGLITDAQLARSAAEVKRLEDDLRQHLTLAEQLENDLYDALKETKEAQPPPTPKPKPTKRRKRDKDRDR